MRIAVIGTQRSGKTTAVNCLAQYSEVSVVREAATDLIEEHGSDIVFEPRFQDMLFAEQTRREHEADRLLATGEIEAWVCDRTIIDNLAYIRYLRRIYTGEDDPETVYPIKGEWLSYIREHPFDLILLCDPDDIILKTGMNLAWQKDGTDRYEGLQEELRIRAEIHAIYQEVLQELGLRFELISGTEGERAAYIESVLREGGITREGTAHGPEGEG